MFFHESEAIARENPGLHDVVEQLDRLLATIFTDAPLRPEDFACNLGSDANQVIAVFELLAGYEILLAEKMVECEKCHNLMSAAAFHQAVADQDDFDCSSCGRPFRYYTPITTVYRMSAETLARPKPAVATPAVELALRDLDQYPNVFRRLGQTWVIKYEGQMILLHSPGGLSYLARLLLDPGRTFPATFLLAAEAGIDPRITTGSSGRVLPDETLAKYRNEYTELTEELEEAKKRRDLGRIALLQ